MRKKVRIAKATKGLKVGNGVVYTGKNVLTAALDRVRWIFDNYKNVCVGYSGGKDSSVILDLVVRVAEEKGKLPINVVFVYQEAEWQGTIDLVEKVFRSAKIIPHWLQYEFTMTNNASQNQKFFTVWDKRCEEKWVREKSPISIKTNPTRATRFTDILGSYLRHFLDNRPFVKILGVRVDESYARRMAVTLSEADRGETWGKGPKQGMNVWFPIWDWKTSDVWKYIYERKLPYNKLYDLMYSRGHSIGGMRISSLIHETALKNLEMVAEIEPKTYERLLNRFEGVSTHSHIGSETTKNIKLPPNFASWAEYSNYLLEHLIKDPEVKEKLKRGIKRRRESHGGVYDRAGSDVLEKTIARSIILGDVDFKLLHNIITATKKHIHLLSQGFD